MLSNLALLLASGQYYYYAPVPTPVPTALATPAATPAATAGTSTPSSDAAVPGCDVVFDFGGGAKEIEACHPSTVCARWQGTHNANFVSSKIAYDACTVPVQTSGVFNAGHIGVFAAPESGVTFRYVCALPNHCTNGAKFAITCPTQMLLGNPPSSSSNSKYKDATIALGICAGIFCIVGIYVCVTKNSRS